MNKSTTSRRAHSSKKILQAAIAGLAAAPLLSSLLPQQAHAATLYWDVNGVTPDSSGGTQAPGSWDGVNTFFNDDPTGGAAGTLTAVTTSADTVVFSAGANATGISTVVIVGTQTVGSVTVEEGTIFHGTGTLALQGSGIMDIAAGATYDVHGAGSGLISGTSGLTKNGAGTIFLGSSESYSKLGGGAIFTLNAGLADFSGDTALGAIPIGVSNSAVILHSGTLRYSGTGATTLNANRGVNIAGAGATIEVTNAAATLTLTSAVGNAQLTGTGLLTKSGAGRMTLNNSGTGFAGKYRVTGGSLNIVGDTRLGPVPTQLVADYLTLDGGGVRNAASLTFAIAANRGVVLGAGGGTFYEPLGFAMTVAGVIAGTSGGTVRISQTDSVGGVGTGATGTVVFAGANTYDGSTIVNANVILAAPNLQDGGVPSSLGQSSSAASNLVLNGGTLQYNGVGGASTNRNFTVNVNTNSSIDGSGSSSAPVTFAGNMTASGSSGTQTLILTGTGTANLMSGSIVNGTGTNVTSLSKTGVGTWTVSNTANSYTGSTTISAGTLALGASNVIPDASVITTALAGSTFSLNNFDDTVKSISGTAGTFALGSGTLTVNNPNGETFSSIMTAAGGKFIKNGTGTLVLAASGTGFNGEMVLNAGKIGVGSANGLGAGTSGSTITIAGNVTLSNTATAGRAVPATAALGINSDFTVDDSLFQPNPGNIQFAGPTTLRNGNRTITTNGPVTLILLGVVGEDAAGRGIIKAGTGTLTLNTVNTYTGDTTINAGTINVDGDGTLGNGAGIFNLSGGRFNITASRNATTDPIANPINLTADSVISTTSGSTSSGLATVNFTSNTVGGGAGTLTFRNDATTAGGNGIFDPRFSGSGFDFARPIVLTNGASGTVRLASFNTSGTQSFSGVITGNGSYRRTASVPNTGGDTIFTGNNTYSGGAILTDGGLGLGIDTTGPAGAVTSGPIGTGNLSVSPNGSNARLFAVGGPRTLGNNIVFTSSPLVISGSNDLDLTGNVDLGAGSRSIQVDTGNAVRFSGTISGTTGITKTGTGAATLSGTNTYQGATWILNGTLHVSAPANLGDGTANNGLLLNGGTLHNTAPFASTFRNVQVDGPGTIDAGDTIALGDVAGSGSLIKAGTGLLVINSIRADNLTINTGVVKIAANGTATGVSVLNTTAPGTGQLDLSDNHLIDHATGIGTWNGTNYTGLTGMVASGRNGNAWNGSGVITSQSAAQGSNYTSIGIAKGSDVFPNTATETGTWAGQTITGTDTLVMYTYGGDATLDGKINIDDYIKIDNGIANGLTGWANGDFNYDGKINIDDYTTVIDANIANQNGIFYSAGGVAPGSGGIGSGVTAVPEPATLSLITLAATSLLSRRRRRS